MSGESLAIDFQQIKNRRGVDLRVWPPRYDPKYLPGGDDEHWLPEVECADPKDRDEVIFFKLQQQIEYAWIRSPFYRRKWQEAGVGRRH